MEDLDCNGDEDSVWKCPHTAQHDCDHNEDAAVTCYMLPSVPSKSNALVFVYTKISRMVIAIIITATITRYHVM